MTPPPPYKELPSITRSEASDADAPPSYRTGYSVNPSSERSNGFDPAKLKSDLRREIEKANAASPIRNTAGMFKASCSTDLLFLIDTTSSMQSYIEEVKERVKSIITEVKKEFLDEAEVRVAVVGYKDHGDTPNVQFLDFTSSANEVCDFVDKLRAIGGADAPEDVLGGINQVIRASWKQQTRCLVHITDAPGHGQQLHDLKKSQDTYYEAGSEPHKLRHETLLRKLIKLHINYALLRVTRATDKMAFVFSGVYGLKNSTLLTGNRYYKQMIKERQVENSSITKTNSVEPRFQEFPLGTSHRELMNLVIRTITDSISLASLRVVSGWSKEFQSEKGRTHSDCARIDEEDESGGRRRARSSKFVPLERVAARWDAPSWFDETLEVEGFSPAIIVHDAATLDAMLAADENINLSTIQLTLRKRSKPFAQGALRKAYYAQTSASNSKFVIKSSLEKDQGRADIAEAMRMQALCKAFALEFNGLLEIQPPLDFVVTACLENKSRMSAVHGGECLSLEPYIQGEYIKYNGNNAWVNEDLADDRFCQLAQAFSHFTFERSWGICLVDDLQGVGHLLTDPAIQTRDPRRFRLSDTNLNEEGFKFFFAKHKCNSFCEKLGLKSNAAMLKAGKFEFRERWPTMERTMCCSNKLCRGIIRMNDSHASEEFPGHRWCASCWPQLASSKIQDMCMVAGPRHPFEVSRFFYESQGQLVPTECPQHRRKDAYASRASVVGGRLWNNMKTTSTETFINSRRW